MSAVQLVVVSITFVGLFFSNVLAVVLVILFKFVDNSSNLQGADYFIASMAVSDLILTVLCVPCSLASESMSQWTLGKDVCEFCAYFWFTLWLVNTYSFLLLSADRVLYITDKKYGRYTNRTRRRCICLMILAWTTAVLFSFGTCLHPVPLFTTLLDDLVCTINWPAATGYFYTVIITTVFPCLLCSTFNFTKIFYWRLQWKTGRTKLTGAEVLILLDSTHVVCLVLHLVFWSSWIPFCIDVYRFSSLKRSLSSASKLYFWIGCAQGIWKFPIMIMFCPRYRECICNFYMVKAANGLRPPTTNHTFCDVEIRSSDSLQQLENTELHM